jgi:hypothetical protein
VALKLVTLKNNNMKNSIKTGLLALTVLFFAACGNGDKSKKTGDSTTIKIDSTTKVSIDSTKKDTGKMDTTKK